MIKILYFDTNAILKYFAKERGSGLIKWIVENRILYSFNLCTSQIAIYEFKKIIKEKEKRGEINKWRQYIFQNIKKQVLIESGFLRENSYWSYL